MVWCRYPDLRTGHDPFDLRSRFWMCLDSSATPSFEKLIPIKIKEERLRMAGRMTVFGMQVTESRFLHKAYMYSLRRCVFYGLDARRDYQDPQGQARQVS